MVLKFSSMVLVAAVMSSSASLAQAQTGTDPAANTTTQRYWRSSKLIGLTVYNVTNEKIGTIEDFVLDKNGGVYLAIIDVGGVVQMDERNLAVAFKFLKWVNTPVGVASPTSSSTPATTWMLETQKPDIGGATRAGQWYPDHAVLAATKSQVKNMSTFKY